MLIPVSKLDLIKAVKGSQQKLPEGGIWRTMHGHKVYIVDGVIVAGGIKGVTDTPEAKKIAKKLHADAMKAPKKDTKKAPVNDFDGERPLTAKEKDLDARIKAMYANHVAEEKKKKAEAEAAKARKAIDEIANSRPKEPKKQTVKEAMAESKKATDEALKNPNKKSKQGKGATKADLDKVIEDNKKNKKPQTKGATKADLDEAFGFTSEAQPKKPTNASEAAQTIEDSKSWQRWVQDHDPESYTKIKKIREATGATLQQIYASAKKGTILKKSLGNQGIYVKKVIMNIHTKAGYEYPENPPEIVAEAQGDYGDAWAQVWWTGMDWNAYYYMIDSEHDEPRLIAKCEDNHLRKLEILSKEVPKDAKYTSTLWQKVCEDWVLKKAKKLTKSTFTDVFYSVLKAELGQGEIDPNITPEYFGQQSRNAYRVENPSEVIYIPVNRLKCPYQTAEALNFDTIRYNVEQMKDGQTLAPVIIGFDYDVHDGHHRIEASKIMKYTHIPCVVGGNNEIAVIRATEDYRDIWKSLISEHLDPAQFPYESTGLVFRGIGQKELDFIKDKGYIESKGKGNDGDQKASVTCFTNLFTQAEGYARSQYDLYHEKQAYVIAVERPLMAEENELGEVEVEGRIPAGLIRGILPIQNSPIGLEKSLKDKVEETDLEGEKKAILDYSERIRAIKDPKVRKVIAEILKDERNHAHNLKCIIAYMKGDTEALSPDRLQKSHNKDLPEGGVWRTIHGSKVYIKDGEILAGRFAGKKLHEVSKNPSEGSVQKPKKPMYDKNERGANPQNKGEREVSNMEAVRTAPKPHVTSEEKGSVRNEKGTGTTLRGNSEQAGQNETGHNRGNGEAGLQQGRSGAPSKSLHVTYAVTKDHKAFHSAIKQAKENNDHGAFVDLHDVDDYAHDTLLMSPSGRAGVAVTPDGNIISVFKDPNSNEKGAMHNIMMNALQHGGKKLDCFNGFLPNMYVKYGMVPVARLKFNREYAPEGWNFERDGEPDVIFMAHNGDSFETVQQKFGEYGALDLSKVPYVEEYDDGIKAQEEHLKKLQR